MDIRFYRPGERLRPYVRYFYALSSRGPLSTLTFPLGCPQIVFHKGTPPFIPELGLRQPRFAVSGQTDFPAHLRTEEEMEMIVAVFYPHAPATLFGIPVAEFRNCEIPGFDLQNRRLSQLARRVFDTPDAGRCVELIEESLAAMLHDRTPRTADFERTGASLRLLFDRAETSAAQMAREACLGPKQFERVFLASVGMRPKEYQKIVRFQRALRMMQLGSRDFAAIACACAYADQSHFIRECRRYSGLTPQRLLATQPLYSDLFTSPV